MQAPLPLIGETQSCRFASPIGTKLGYRQNFCNKQPYATFLFRSAAQAVCGLRMFAAKNSRKRSEARAPDAAIRAGRAVDAAIGTSWFMAAYPTTFEAMVETAALTL